MAAFRKVGQIRWNDMCLHGRPGVVYRMASAAAKKKKINKESGSVRVLNPLDAPDYFKVRNLVTIPQLLDARVHLGHKTGTQNQYMRPFIFGNRLGVDIIDLEQTHSLLGDALNFVAHVAYRQGIIMFVSRNKQTLPLVERTAKLCGQYSHCREFKLGTFTSSTSTYGLDVRLPDLAVFLTTHNNVFGDSLAVVECAKMNIPSVGILDTNCDPRLINYPIPGNDDSPVAMELYCALFKRAIMAGKAAIGK